MLQGLLVALDGKVGARRSPLEQVVRQGFGRLIVRFRYLGAPGIRGRQSHVTGVRHGPVGGGIVLGRRLGVGQGQARCNQGDWDQGQEDRS